MSHATVDCSLYDEELVLMLARMDTLLLLGTTSMPKLAQLALKITCKIVLIMQEVRETASEHMQHIAPFISCLETI